MTTPLTIHSRTGAAVALIRALRHLHDMSKAHSLAETTYALIRDRELRKRRVTAVMITWRAHDHARTTLAELVARLMSHGRLRFHLFSTQETYTAMEVQIGDESAFVLVRRGHQQYVLFINPGNQRVMNAARDQLPPDTRLDTADEPDWQQLVYNLRSISLTD